MLGRRGVFPVLKVRVIRNNLQNRDTYVPDKRESRTVPEARSSALRARKAGIPSRYGLAPFWSVGHNRSLQEGDANEGPTDLREASGKVCIGPMTDSLGSSVRCLVSGRVEWRV